MNGLKGMNSQTPEFFLCEIEHSVESRAHFVDLLFEKWSEGVNFLRPLCEMELPPQSRAHFVDLIFQKWSEVFSFLTLVL